MGAGPLSFITPVLGMLGKGLAGGAGGGAGGGAAAAAGPGPWDAITTGQPPAPPPAPEQNPLFASDRELFSGARLIPPAPMRKSMGLFDETLGMSPEKAMPKGGVLPSGVPPMPERNPALSDIGTPQMVDMPEKNPAFHDMPEEMQMGGLFAQQPTAALAKSAPINSLDKRNNSERFSDAGYTLTSGQGEELPKSVNSLVDVPMPSRKTPEAQTVDDVAPDAPKLDRGLFEGPKKTKVVPDDEDAENGVENGMGLLPDSIGEPLGSFQDALGESATNPMFQAGMSLLAGGFDGSNPWKMMAGQLSNIPGHQIAAQNADLALTADARAERADARAERDQARQERESAAKLQQDSAMAELAKLLAAMGIQDPSSRSARGAATVIR